MALKVNTHNIPTFVIWLCAAGLLAILLRDMFDLELLVTIPGICLSTDDAIYGSDTACAGTRISLHCCAGPEDVCSPARTTAGSAQGRRGEEEGVALLRCSYESQPRLMIGASKGHASKMLHNPCQCRTSQMPRMI
eukprot:3134819-Rhodomonas_salina.1